MTGGAPELNAHFRRLTEAARGLGATVIDRCNLTILEEPGHEDLGAVSRPPAGADRRLAPLLLAGERRPPARRRRVREEHPRAAPAERARLCGRGFGTVPGPRLQPAGAVAPAAAAGPRAGLQAPARRELRGELQPAADHHQPADRALRQHADQQGPVPRLHGTAARRAPAGEPAGRDVPLARVGRLAGWAARLRLQPDAGHAACVPKVVAATSCTCATC